MIGRRYCVVSVALLLAASKSRAGVFITEFCSDTGNNEHFEFVEITNLGAAPVNMSGWSADDSHATANVSGHSLSGLGILAPGQSGIFTEAMPADFRAYWRLAGTVPIVGSYTNDNLSTTADSITLFNPSGTLVDRLDYSTTNGGSADMITRNAPLAALGRNNNGLWVNSSFGDSFGSYAAPGKTLFALYGNPGTYSAPEPGSLALLAFPLALLLRRHRTRANSALRS